MLIILSVILAAAVAQQQTTLTQPPLLETSTLTLSPTLNSSFTFTTTATFMQNYTSQPLVFTCLVSINTLIAQSTSTFTQQIATLTTTSFTLTANLAQSIAGTGTVLPKIGILYLAFDYASYPFMQLLTSTVSLPPATSNTYITVHYLSNSPSAPPHNYSLNVVLAGYSSLLLAPSGTPALYIDALQYNPNKFLLNVQTTNLNVNSLQILRMIIDTTAMQAASTGLSSLYCSTGDIVHVSDPNVVQNNNDPDFLPFAMLYGVKGWTGLSFSLTSFPYIFNNTNPRVTLTIGYLLFQTKSCPTNQLYVHTQNLCYSREAAFYYQLTPTTMAPCPYSCYACVGPLTTQCRVCMQGSHRYLSSGRCLCIPGFYDPGSATCLNCSLAISGCFTCSSATNCLTCQSGCTAINLSPIYCDCPAHVQSNFSYNCPAGYYYDYDRQGCTCLPQTYYNTSAAMCFPCGFACYICANQTRCLLCIDSFTLTRGRCVFYPTSYYLLGQGVSSASPYTRCLRWDPSATLCLQTCKKYYYQANCYGFCPTGTFNISFPWKTCQPCPVSCQMCYNLTLCLHCQTTYFYFNTSTFHCDRCGDHCINCINHTTCTTCEKHYSLTSGACLPASPPANNCTPSCSYCIANTCLTCRPPYYLNHSNCYSCLNNHAFTFGPTGQCLQLCGDGVVLLAGCDDGNTQNGDGCSSTCTIEDGYQCQTLAQRSYCWNAHTKIQWNIYPFFSQNQFALQINAERPLPLPLLQLTCSFNHSRTTVTNSTQTVQYRIDYQQTIIATHDFTHQHNLNTILGNHSSNQCLLSLGNLGNYTITINTNPQTLLLNYDSTLGSLTQSELLTKMCSLAVILVLAFQTTAIAPASAATSLRTAALIFATYIDYTRLPINSFTPYQATLSLLFEQNGNDTRHLTTFNKDFYFQLLWKITLLYFATFLLHELPLRYLTRFIKNMDWKNLSKLTQHITDNKAKTYHSLYTAYDLIALLLTIQVAQHLSLSDPKLIFFAFLQPFIWIATKIHLYFTYPPPQEHTPYARLLVTDQLQNVVLAILIQFSNNSLSYSPVVIILFATYSIAALLASSASSAPKQAKQNQQFYLSQKIAFWQLVVNLALIIILQILKCACIWRGIAGISPQNYESLGQIFGIAMSLLGSATLLLNALCTFLCLFIKVCELTVQKEESSEMATVDHPSVEIVEIGN